MDASINLPLLKKRMQADANSFHFKIKLSTSEKKQTNNIYENIFF